MTARTIAPAGEPSWKVESVLWGLAFTGETSQGEHENPQLAA